MRLRNRFSKSFTSASNPVDVYTCLILYDKTKIDGLKDSCGALIAESIVEQLSKFNGWSRLLVCTNLEHLNIILPLGSSFEIAICCICSYERLATPDSVVDRLGAAG